MSPQVTHQTLTPWHRRSASNVFAHILSLTEATSPRTEPEDGHRLFRCCPTRAAPLTWYSDLMGTQALNVGESVPTCHDAARQPDDEQGGHISLPTGSPLSPTSRLLRLHRSTASLITSPTYTIACPACCFLSKTTSREQDYRSFLPAAAAHS